MMITEYQKALMGNIMSGEIPNMMVHRGSGKTTLVYRAFLRRMALEIIVQGHTTCAIVTSNEARTDEDFAEVKREVRKELEKDIGVIIRNMGFPEYDMLQEFLDDWLPVAGACALRGRPMRYLATENTRKKRKAHCEWVARISGEKVGRIRRFLERQR